LWVALCLLPALAGAAAFLAEWQRRATLIALVRHAPGGTVVVQERGRGGPAMQVHVGAPSETDQGETGVTQQGQEKGQLVAALWEREAKGLARYAMVRTGGDKAAAEDLVQQTFMAAFLQWDESLADLDAEEHRNWLRSVCRRRWIDGIRRETLGDRLQADAERLYDRVSPDPAHAVTHEGPEAKEDGTTQAVGGVGEAVQTEAAGQRRRDRGRCAAVGKFPELAASPGGFSSGQDGRGAPQR
jgi:DNA-directed RNA polymerase specialized sigma24 family protein